MANLEKLVEELSALTVLEAAQLSKLLRRSGASAPPLRSRSPPLRALLPLRSR